MAPDSGDEPPVHDAVRRLAPDAPLQQLGRFDFYDAARGPDVALAIATGEQRIYANVLVTIGVVLPD
jgi:L-fucose mutarotase